MKLANYKFLRLNKYVKKYFSTYNIEKATKEVLKFNPQIPIEEAVTPPSSWYLSKDFFHLECEKVFKKNWIGLCSDHELKDNGDYITGEILEQPYIILNNQKNEKKAFYNVCSHHAAQVASGSGTCQELVCPYHGWTYNLDGNLTKSTQMKGIKNFRPKNYGLKNINLSSLGKILFLNFNKINKESENLDNENNVKLEENFKNIISPFQKCLEKFNFDPTFSDLEFVQKKEYRLKSNWKVFIDNYCDGGYHVPYAHKNLCQKLDMSTYKIEIHDKLSLQTTENNKNDKDTRIGNGAVYAFLYPNIMFNRYGPWLDINVAVPVNENECIIYFEWFLDKNLINNQIFIKESLESSSLVQDEDIFLCETVMKGLKSDAYDEGRYVPSKEGPAYHFHQELYKDLNKI